MTAPTTNDFVTQYLLARRELPDGLFPTEPLFLAAPGATAEDDGLVLMSGPDGGNQV